MAGLSSKLTKMFTKALDKVADVIKKDKDNAEKKVECSRKFNDSMDSLKTTLEHMNRSDNNLTSYAAAKNASF